MKTPSEVLGLLKTVLELQLELAGKLSVVETSVRTLSWKLL
jgi:hypothetical protein